jgi:hypothetical protein
MASKSPRASSTNQLPHHPAHTSLSFSPSSCLSPRSSSRLYRARRCSTGTCGGSVLTTACRLPLSHPPLLHIGVVSTLQARRRSPWVQRLGLRTDAPGLSISGSSKENGSCLRFRSDSSSGFSFSSITTSLCADPSYSLFHPGLINGAVLQSLISQGSEFPLRKPAGFHYDFALLGLTTFLAGLLGIPAPNGLIPQAPIHTRSLLVHKLVRKDEGPLNSDGEGDLCEVPVAVVEQRVSNLAQGSLCLVLLTRPFLHVLNLVPQGTRFDPSLLNSELTHSCRRRARGPVVRIYVAFWTRISSMEC